MNRTSPIRPLAVAVALLVLTSLSRVSAQDGTTIVITPEKGVANSFELVRVYPDKVEVRREGIRLNFSRDSIKSVRNTEASEILNEAQAIIEQVGEEKIEEFPALLERAERTTPRIEGVVQKFDWLIPEATQTLLDMRQTLFALRDTARAAERLEMLDAQVQKMAEGTTTLSATWEQIIDQGIEVTDAIPFPAIQKDFLDRFTKMRRNIRLDLSQRRTRSIDRIKTIGEELLAQVEAGTLRESRLTLAMNELDRLYEGILDPDAKREIGVFVEEVKEKTSREIELVREKEAYAASVQAVQALKEGLQSGAIAPATGERVPELVRAKDLLAALPDSPTKEILSVDLSDLEVQVAQAMASSVPRGPGGGVDIPPPGPGDTPPGQDNSMLGTLKRSLGLGAAIGAGVVVLLIVLMILAGRMMKKRKKAKFPEAAPEFTSQYDIFQMEGEEKQFPFSPSPVTSPIPSEPAPTASAADLFGFEPEPEPELVLAGPAGSSGEAPIAQSVPDDPFDLPPEPDKVEDDLFGFGEEEETSSEPDSPPTATAEEDPFLLEDRDPTADLEIDSRPPPEPLAPTSPEEEDIFGLGNLDEETPEPSLPPAPAAPPTTREPDPFAPESTDFDETLDDDPLGLKASASPPPPAPTEPTQPPPSPPAPEIPEPSTSSADDDPFGFNNLLTEDDDNSPIEDDLFADSDSKD